MYELKPLSKGAIPNALEKAQRYRLLNEPAAAESICLDVLDIDPENEAALVMLLLARADQFESGDASPEDARAVLPRLPTEYDRAYYAGLICERRARAALRSGRPGSGFVAYEGLTEAMSWYEKAEALRPPDNDDALLRWNTCARVLIRHPHLSAPTPEGVELPLE